MLSSTGHEVNAMAAPQPADRAGSQAQEQGRPADGGQPEPATETGEVQPDDRAGGHSTAELIDYWRRTAADLDNLRKRLARELERERNATREQVSAAWLPVLDNLELALENAGADQDSIVEGVRAVRDQAVAVLAGLGYPRHDEVGVPFDPRRHEVVNVAQVEGAVPGTVLAVHRPGYGNGERQLRPAAVTVAGQPG
jgi:molecular chaperone GrpE